MTKAEELKLLEKIEELIDSADEDSYIRMTFDGIGAVCMENIRADFGNCPVRDLDELREQFSAEVIRHDETKHLLADAQNIGSKAIEERDELRIKLKDAEEYRKSADKTIDDMIDKIEELTEERDCFKENAEGLQDLYDRSQEEAVNAIRQNNHYEKFVIPEKDAEIMRLKAEIYDLRKECGK